jgi:FkbM family methyltransferase
MKDYSQNGEQAVIFQFFGNYAGKFLDIGAYDGKDMSNTMGLVEKGWKGVCLEPSRPAFEALERNHKDTGVQCMNLALSNATGTVLLYDANGGGASTTVEKLKNQWVAGGCVKFTPVMTPCVSAPDLLKKTGGYHDFVNIDTEWTSAENLLALLAAGLRFRLLCVEHDNKPDEIASKLPPGIVVHHKNKVNLILEDRRQ